MKKNENCRKLISDVKNVAKFKVEIERPLCISCESCVNICPKFWEMATDGFSHLKDSKKVGENEEREMDDVSCNIEVAEGCPAICIHVYENEKKILSEFLVIRH